MPKGVYERNKTRKVQRRISLYRVSSDLYEEMLREQGYVCKICRQPESRRQKGQVDNLSVDHCHKSGVVRGLLCNRCNVILGLSKDNQVTLLRAIQYLKGQLK